MKMLRANEADAARIRRAAAKLHMTIPCFINGLINFDDNVTYVLRSSTSKENSNQVREETKEAMGNMQHRGKSGVDWWSPQHEEVIRYWAKKLGVPPKKSLAGQWWVRTLNAAMQPIEAGGCGLTIEALYWIIDNLHLDTGFSIDLAKGRVVPLSRILQFRDRVTRDVDPAAPLPRMLDLYAAMAGPAEKTTVTLEDGREVQV